MSIIQLRAAYLAVIAALNLAGPPLADAMAIDAMAQGRDPTGVVLVVAFMVTGLQIWAAVAFLRALNYRGGWGVFAALWPVAAALAALPVRAPPPTP